MSESTTNNSTKGGGLAIAALILGIVAILSSFIPLAGIFLVWAPAVVGLILGIIGLTGGRPSRVMALIGVILSGLSIVLVIIFTSVALGAVSSAIDSSSLSDTSSETTSEEVTTGEVTQYVYEVTGDGGTANVTYASFSDGEYSSQSANGTAIPFTYTGEITNDGLLDYTSLSLLAIGTDATTTLTCKITVNGEVVSENTSTGAYATVMCSQAETNIN